MVLAKGLKGLLVSTIPRFGGLLSLTMEATRQKDCLHFWNKFNATMARKIQVQRQRCVVGANEAQQLEGEQGKTQMETDDDDEEEGEK